MTTKRAGNATAPLAPGRYCLATCYCGECPHWKPIAARQYATPAEQKITKTWTEREAETWIDTM